MNIVGCKIDNIVFFSLYIYSPSLHCINFLHQLFSNTTGPFIVLGDFNFHHHLWGSSSCDIWGKKLIDLLDNFNLCLLNDGRPTRRSSPVQGPSAVDLSFCSNSLASNFLWDIDRFAYGSDHLPIIISFVNRAFSFVPPPPLLKYNLNRAKWEVFSDSIDCKMASLPHLKSDNMLECLDAFYKCLTNTANECFPIKKNGLIRRSSPPWWDDECTNSIKLRKQAEKLYCNSMTLDNFINYKHVLAKTKRFLKKKKFTSWRKFCSSLSPSSRSSIVWQSIRRFRASQVCSRFNLPPFSSWTEHFLDKLAPPYVPTFEECYPAQAIPTVHPLDHLFTICELKSVLSHVKDSAPGMDGIPYSFIVHCPDTSLNYFLEIINSVFVSGSIPSQWKSQLVIPILKPDKDPASFESYRPIALSSVLCKLLEHLIKNRLEWFVENRELLSANQFGFRKSRSTLDNLSILTTDIRLAFSRNESLVAVFLDINSAYDSVNLSLLKNKMLNIGFPPGLTHFIFRLMIGRSISLRLFDRVISNRLIWKGLPQGSVLSPLLYNIYTRDLDSVICPNCKCLQFADDVVVYLSVKKIEFGVNVINNSLYLLNSWLDSHGLLFSYSKCKSVIFSRKRVIPPVTITIGDNVIDILPHVKFLGVFLDSKLSFKKHIEFILAKCEKNLNILRVLSGVWWGSHPFCQRLIYNAIIRSVIDYGCIILEPCNYGALHKLDLIQYRALRIIIGAMKSSPVNALQVECADPPYKLRRQFLSDKYIFKSFQFSNHPLHPKLQLLSEYVQEKAFWTHKRIPNILYSFTKFNSFKTAFISSRVLPIFSIPFRSLFFRPDINLSIGITKKTPCANSIFSCILDDRWAGWKVFFTDASKRNSKESVGFAVYFQNADLRLCYKCPWQSSVFTGECLAILAAIMFISDNKLINSVIFTDSLSALMAIKQNPIYSGLRSHIICRIRFLLFQCANNVQNVSLVYIPSHCGIRGNEIADEAAKYAIVNGDHSYYRNYCYDIASLAREFLVQSWSNSWNRSSKHKGSHLFSIQPFVSMKPWFSKFNFLEKHITSTLCRVRLGHCCVPVHLHKLHVLNNQHCDCGFESGDINHLFFACPLNVKPVPLYSILYLFHIPLPTSISSLISIALQNKNVLVLLAKFIHCNNIRI